MTAISVWKAAIREFWAKNELKVILTLGLILIAAVSFESGYLKGKTAESSPIIIEKSISGQNLSPESAQGIPLGGQNSLQEAKSASNGATIPSQKLSTPEVNCVFVGSKNSNKYHLPTCRYAKLIKPENIICFSSAEDAAAKNYLPDKGCIK
ncbi:MAG: hypothetical protein AAB487_03160 [Patescibacteria group bacterium]